MPNYSADVDYSKIITIEPGKRNGKPCIREDINACFAFAADRERKLFVAPA